MGKKKYRIYIAMIIVASVAFILSNIYETKKSAAFPYVPESQYPITSGSASFYKTFSSVKELYDTADLVAKAEVVNHRFEQPEGSLVYTYTDLKIKKVYKGEQNLKTARVCEMGGLLDTSKVKITQKDGDPQNSQVNQGTTETTIEGSPTMRAGNEYIVFLTKYPGGDYYNVVGSVQGKIKIDEKKNQALATVTEERVKKDGLYFLQKKYAGAKIEDIEAEINSSK